MLDLTRPCKKRKEAMQPDFTPVFQDDHSMVKKIPVTASLNRFRVNTFTSELLKYWWAFMSKSIRSENDFDSSIFSW